MGVLPGLGKLVSQAIYMSRLLTHSGEYSLTAGTSVQSQVLFISLDQTDRTARRETKSWAKSGC